MNDTDAERKFCASTYAPILFEEFEEYIMADGRWVMTEEELNRTACGFDGGKSENVRELPNFGKHEPVDDRDGTAPQICAFCGSRELITGLGGYGDGYGYRSARCRSCGGTTDFVYKDIIGKYFSK